MHNIDSKVLESMDQLPNHAQSILSDIITHAAGEDADLSETQRRKYEVFIAIVVAHYEDVMPEIEMLHSRIFENQWEDDNPHFAEHIHDIIDDMITDYN